MRELEYPFNAEEIVWKKKHLKKALSAEEPADRIDKRIAILGGETTENIRLILELFLLNYGIRPVFYESEYGRYYEDGMFPNPELEAFRPDIIYICTCIHNIPDFPDVADDAKAVNDRLDSFTSKLYGLWDNLLSKYGCPVIQNNFEFPIFRLMGNMDAADVRGRVNYITRLNCRVYEYAQQHKGFYVCDVNYLSAQYGLDKWSDPFYWYMYKYAVAVPAIPYLSFNVANIIKSIYGKNKKAFNLDLDNTLWGGVIGDDGSENIEIGQETAIAETYSAFQEYIKLHKQIGVLLTVNSKNEEETAKSGFLRPDSVLSSDDFVSFKANWENKDKNLTDTADELSLLPESFVFIDDNPAEREMIRQSVKGTAVPEISEPEHYIQTIDRSGFFEVTSLSEDDLTRNRMYRENAARKSLEKSYGNYEDYLRSLDMHGEIGSFAPVYMSRIAQLTNKSNQFNLTTKRYTQSEIESVAKDPDRITLYGRLTDRFGDNGVVSVVIGRIEGEKLHIELWLMSCRVLKRRMEYAMMDELAYRASEKGIREIHGYYYPTAKNGMVRDFYHELGFVRVDEGESGNTEWVFKITNDYKKKQNVIAVNEMPEHKGEP